MKTLLTFAFIFCIAVMLIAGCSNNGDGVVNDVPNTDIFPLGDNNSWTYMQYFYNSDGILTDSTEGMITVVGTETIDSDKVFLVEGIDGDTLIMGGGQTGLWVYPVGGFSQLYIPYPVNVGDSVIFTFDNGITWASCVCESIDDTVYLSMGTYVCWKYKETPYYDPAHIYYYYFYPTIGLMQRDDWRMDVSPEYIERRLKLIDYTVD